MGRGRAKAKQTRVARDLKYRSVETDFASLERELKGKNADGEPVGADEYADLAAEYENDYDGYEDLEDDEDLRA